jgi:hypothetical protein
VAKEKKASPTWIDVKAALGAFDRAGLLGVVQDLYAVGKDRLGANLGYLKFTPQSTWNPF